MKTNLQQTRALNYVVLRLASFFEIKRSEDEARKINQNNLILINSNLTLKSLLICMMFFMYGITNSWSQATSIWNNPITGSNPGYNNPYTNGDVTSSYITVSGIGESGLSGRSGNNRYNVDGFSTSNNINTNTDYFSFTITPLQGYHINFNSFEYDATRQGGGSGGPREFAFRSSENGSNDIGSPDSNGATLSLTNSNHQNITSAIQFRFYGWDSNSSNGDFSIDDFDFTGGILGSGTTALSGFSSCSGIASEAQSFIVNGEGLSTSTATITIGGSANYEVSITSSLSGFSNSVTFNASGGSVSQTVWVRLKATASSGSHSEDITISGGGFSIANGIAVNCSGAVNLAPSALVVDASSYSICEDGSINLSASAVSNSAVGTVVLLNEDFNAGTNSWTTINNSTGGTSSAAAWTLRPDGFNSTYNGSVTSNDNSQFYFTDSDAQGEGSTTETILQSPSFSTVGLATANLTFYHFFRSYGPANDEISVQASTDGTFWVDLTTYTSNQGNSNSFEAESVSLGGYLNEATLYIRFKYYAEWGYYYAIDNVSVSGLEAIPPAPTYSWTSTPPGFVSDEQNPTNVVPSSNTTYTVTVTNSFGCTASATTALVEVLPNVMYYADVDGDGFGDDEDTLLTCIQPEGYVTIGGDCDDTNDTVYPGAAEICYDGLDNDCNGTIDDGCTPITSVVQATQCGVTLDAVNSYVYAVLVPEAQGYRFRVTNLSTNQVQSIDQLLRAFRITQLTNYAFNTTYSVEVSVRINNVWQPFYGTPCTVSTPDTTTQIQASQFNSTLTNITNTVFADIVPFAAGYRFRVTNTLNPVDVQTIDRPIRDFKMSSLPNTQYNTTYNVEVSVRNTDGTYLSYGPACNISTPLFPTIGMDEAQCDEYQVTSNSETLYVESYPGAEQYRFLLENVSQPYSQTFDRPLRTVTLNNFTGLLPGTTYTVRVAIQLNGVWGPYGKSCSIITPGNARPEGVARVDENTINEFKAVAYPNPFATSFAIDVRTSNSEKVSLTVYDMTGRLLESNEVNAADATHYQFGERYPSGVYNVIVTQGEETRTVRVVKQ